MKMVFSYTINIRKINQNSIKIQHLLKNLFYNLNYLNFYLRLSSQTNENTQYQYSPKRCKN